jgi:hypothetical protein
MSLMEKYVFFPVMLSLLFFYSVCLSCKLFTFQASSPKTLGQLEPNLAGMFIGWSSTKFLFFVPVGYSTWLPGPMICSDWLKFQRCRRYNSMVQYKCRRYNSTGQYKCRRYNSMGQYKCRR